jgi:hypothetical protein
MTMLLFMRMKISQKTKKMSSDLVLKDRKEGFFSIRKIGDPDFCDNGCVLVDEIRVPFPDCLMHGKPFTEKQSVV